MVVADMSGLLRSALAAWCRCSVLKGGAAQKSGYLKVTSVTKKDIIEVWE